MSDVIDLAAVVRPSEERVADAARAKGWDPAVLILRREARCGCPADWTCTLRDRTSHTTITAPGSTPAAAAQAVVSILRGCAR